MPSPLICFDCEPLRDRHSGFSHFVLPLAEELVRQNHRYRLCCYVPPAEVGGLDNQVSLGYRTLNDPLHPTELPDRTYPHNLPVELPLTTVRGSHENRAELA